MAAQLADLLGRTDFGHPLDRLDITITSDHGPDPDGESEEHLRTLHFTFTQDESGFTEDLLYRNLHPMIAKRLDLWRLANFSLRRLPSAENIYLFRAVAKENAKDERLIAVAEVRDLTAARNSAGRIIGFPHLEGLLAQVLADLRQRTQPPAGQAAPAQQPDHPVCPAGLEHCPGDLAKRGSPAGPDGGRARPGEGRGQDQDGGRRDRREP